MNPLSLLSGEARTAEGDLKPPLSLLMGDAKAADGEVGSSPWLSFLLPPLGSELLFATTVGRGGTTIDAGALEEVATTEKAGVLEDAGVLGEVGVNTVQVVLIAVAAVCKDKRVRHVRNWELGWSVGAPAFGHH